MYQKYTPTKPSNATPKRPDTRWTETSIFSASWRFPIADQYQLPLLAVYVTSMRAERSGSFRRRPLRRRSDRSAVLVEALRATTTFRRTWTRTGFVGRT